MTKWGILRVSLCWVKYSESIFKPIVISASQGANQVTWGSKYIKPHSHHMYTTSKAGGWTPGPQTNRGPAALMLSGFLSGFLLTSKVVFVWFDRGMLEFQSKIACQCPHWLPRWQWDTVQQTTADHGGQQGSQLSACHGSVPTWATAGKATQGTHAARHSPLRGGTVDEDKSWETKVTGESKNEPKSAVQALNKIIHHSVAASKYKVQILWSLQSEYITTDQQLQGQTFTEAQNFGQDNRLTAIQPVLTAWPQWDKAVADSSLKYATSIQRH